MTVGELKQELEDLESQDKLNDNTEIRIAHQPRWAFEYSLGDSVAVVWAKDEYSEDRNPVVYLEEARQIGYLPQPAADAIGW